MSLALYRKYRPGTLAEVVGQEHVTGPLRTALTNGRLHHAYLFSGPRGCGKTSSARILARSLNCATGPTPDPCGTCDSCVALAPNGPGSLDVLEIDAASHNGVDDARDLRERAFYAPVRDRFKVYIIDEAHMITKEAFNALLKLVEEPPDFVTFVFATTEPEKVLGTIRSRTHHYPFRLMPRRDLTDLLQRVVDSEGIPVEPGVLSLVVRAAAGSARDGLSILDQVLASAGAQGVRREAAASLLGVTPDTLLDDVVDAFAAGDAAAVFAAVDQVMERGHDPHRFAVDVLDRLRDLIILEAVPDAASRGLVDCPPEQVQRMTRQAAALGRAGLSRAADVFADGLVDMRGKTTPRLLLELMCARVLLPGASDASSALVDRLERVERRLDIRAPDAGSPPAVPPRGPGPVPGDVTRPRTAPGPGPAAGSRPAGPTERAAHGRPAPGPEAAVPAPNPPGPAAPTPDPPGPAWPAPARPGGQPAADDVPAPAPGGAAEDDLPAAAPGGLDAAAVRRVWDDVLRAVRSRSRSTEALLGSVHVADVSGRTLTLAFQHAPLMRQFQSRAGVEVLREALAEVLGADLEISCTNGAPTHEAARPAASAPHPCDGFAPGDEPDEAPPSATTPVVGGDDAALRLVETELGATVLGTTDGPG